MPRMPEEKALTPAALRGKRIGLCVVIALAVAFIGATAVHVIPAVFGVWIVPVPRGPCALGLRELEQALGAAGVGPRPQAPPSSVQSACAQTPAGEDAWASFERLRLAEGQLGGRDPAALSRLKQDLDAHLPTELR
jgi:hypothetical protein